MTKAGLWPELVRLMGSITGILRKAWWMAALGSAIIRCDAAVIIDGPKIGFTNGTQAVITWSTDVSTGTRVFFGESPSRMTRRVEGAQGVTHAAVLPELAPGTKWFFCASTARVPLATNSFIVGEKFSDGHGQANATEGPAGNRNAEPEKKSPTARQTWGHPQSLADHFARHGRDFKAKDADEYARMAWEFRQRAKAEGLPTKVDSDGVTRVYDPKSGAFAAYNRDGTTKTFFKPGSRDYFDRQPGELVHPKKNH